MREFLLFAGANYYPSGGMNDYLGDYDTIEEAKAAIDDHGWDWADIVRHADMKRVAWYNRPHEIPDLPKQKNPTAAGRNNVKFVEKLREQNKTRGWHTV